MYRSRRDALLTALTRHLPELEPAGIAAGLHLVAWLPQDLEEPTVIAAAARQGVAIAGVTPYRLSPTPRCGLIFGYSNLNERAIAAGITRLARAVAGGYIPRMRLRPGREDRAIALSWRPARP